jgi:hypothetical protein
MPLNGPKHHNNLLFFTDDVMGLSQWLLPLLTCAAAKTQCQHRTVCLIPICNTHSAQPCPHYHKCYWLILLLPLLVPALPPHTQLVTILTGKTLDSAVMTTRAEKYH